MLLTRLAYPFAIVAGIGLMVAEMHVPDPIMVVLLCATIIGHVWLTGRAVRALLIDERKDAMNRLFAATHADAANQQHRPNAK